MKQTEMKEKTLPELTLEELAAAVTGGGKPANYMRICNDSKGYAQAKPRRNLS